MPAKRRNGFDRLSRACKYSKQRLLVLTKSLDKLNSNAKELLDENLNNAKERYNNYKNLETKEK